MTELSSRTRLLDVPVGLVEDQQRSRVRPEPGPEGYCGVYQICFPYRGVFVWEVGGGDVVGDANHVVFVRPGETYRMRAPLPEGYAELIVTPEPGTLAEIAHARGVTLDAHPLFARRIAPATARLQRACAGFYHAAASARHGSGLEDEEALLALLRLALDDGTLRPLPLGSRTARLLRRTKEFLHAHLANRVLLRDIAAAVEASPAYLTDLFARVEGMPLHHYLTRLRLARALVEVPHASDLTALALQLGFSSHSHFTYAFRRAFGCTPSSFREAARRPRRGTMSSRPPRVTAADSGRFAAAPAARMSASE